jgi:integral membrane protein
MDVAILRRLRLLGLAEGVTLLLLVFVAVPLKRLAGVVLASKIMGPVHGVVFLLYVYTLVEAIASGGWTRRAASRAALACLVPFGTFLNDRAIRRYLEGASS